MTRRLDDASPFDCVQIPECPRVKQYPETAFSGGPHSIDLASAVWALRRDVTTGLGAGGYWAAKFLNRFLAAYRGNGTLKLEVWDGSAWSTVDTTKAHAAGNYIPQNGVALGLDGTRLYFVSGVNIVT